MSAEIFLNGTTLLIVIAQIGMLARWSGKVDTRLDSIEARQDRER